MSRQVWLLILAGVAAAPCLGPAAARADFLDPSTSFGSAAAPLPLNFGPSSTPPLAPLVLPQFNPALGNLTGITLLLNATLEGTYSIHNTSNGDESFAVISSGKITMTAPGGQSLAVPLLIDVQPVTLHANTSLNNVNVASAPGTVSLSVPTSDFAAFEGTGTFSTTVTGAGTPPPQPVLINGLEIPLSTPSAIVAYNGHDGGTVSQAGYGTLSVLYQFTPVTVPEPTGFVLLASGAGLAWLARRRSARARAAHGTRG